MRIAIAVLAAALTPVWAQEIKLPSNLEHLAAKARESVTVTMDKSMLRLAGRFLSDRDDEAKAKKVMAGLEGISVWSFEFEWEGEYNTGDVDAVRAQLQAPAWSRIVGVKSQDGENVDVYCKSAANGQ